MGEKAMQNVHDYGVYALEGGSFLVNAPLPKSPYNNVKMVV
jgi:hypothetical protein